MHTSTFIVTYMKLTVWPNSSMERQRLDSCPSGMNSMGMGLGTQRALE